jgi:hypothetical protein
MLECENEVALWRGKGTKDEEVANAIKFVASWKGPDCPVAVEQEGQESDRFWTLLDRSEYPNEPFLLMEDCVPVLFHCSEASGAFNVVRVLDFSQEDLVSHEVFILDVKYQIFVWAGTRANELFKKEAMETALEYAKLPQIERPADLKVYLITPGYGQWGPHILFLQLSC